MNAAGRDEIASESGLWIAQLQYQGQSYKDGQVFQEYAIVFVPDPYTAR